jgi:hypothetical protein
VGGCDGASALVDGRHESRQRVGHLASLATLVEWRERKEMNKIYAAGKKKERAK